VYQPDCLRWMESEVRALEEGELLVRTLLLSLDPTSRNWLKLEAHSQYLPIKIGDVMLGVAVGEVVESRAAQFARGDIVTGMWGWEDYSIANPAFVQHVPSVGNVPKEAYLSIFSHVGRAAVMGLLAIGQLKPTDCVVISGAAGATGGLAVQIAKAYGCRVVGIAGRSEKRQLVTTELGADAALDYKSEDIGAGLRRLCPDGVDLFFDNVGGPILDAVLAHMAVGCRIVVCGAMSQYDLGSAAEEYGCRNLPQLLFRRGRIEGFVVPQFADRYAEFDAILAKLFAQGKLSSRAHVVQGLENAPEALKLLFSGGNRGKLMVRISAQ
jgi:NADPH-dependent curcumin reductase CurA